MTIRRANERGHFKNEWLDTNYSFSFSDYFDPSHMGFHDLRVINEDRVAPAGGFPTHGHQNMEIITYLVSGAIAHKDSMGNVETLSAGEVQVMSAGTGVLHSEFNPSQEEGLKLLQIWIKPATAGVEPGYSQRKFAREEKLNQLCLLTSQTGERKSLKINQDVKTYASILEAGRKLDVPVERKRAAWLQVVSGNLKVKGEKLSAGDGLAIAGPAALQIEAENESEFILFDLPRRH